MYRSFENFFGYNPDAFYQRGRKRGIPHDVLIKKIGNDIDEIWKKEKKKHENDGFEKVDESEIPEGFL